MVRFQKKKDYKQSLQEWMKSEKFNEWMKQNEIEEVDLKLYHTEVGIPSNVCILCIGQLKNATMIMPV